MKKLCFIPICLFFIRPSAAEPLSSAYGVSGVEVPEAVMRVPQTAGPKSSVGTDMSGFFRRLESIGLSTREIRAVTGRIDVVFREPSSDAAAEYGYVLNNLYIPGEYRDKDGGGVRFDLGYNLINTLIHEYVHAARDVRAAADAKPGTPAREHYEAVAAIRADLRSQAFFYRYSWMKADEVSAYFMGAAIGRVFEKVQDIIFYNTLMAGAKPASEEEAMELGGRFILPPLEDDGGEGFAGLGRNYVFGRNSVYDDAQFKADSVTGLQYIRWEERQWVKDNMYRHILGLNPPRDTAELLERMNTLETPWLREQRAKVAAVRLENAGKAKSSAR